MPDRQFRIRGHVQGVGFRWWTRSRARGLGVIGSVRNEDDGSVLVRARGSEVALDRLRSALERGPSGARVARVEEEPTEPISVGEFVIEH